MITNQKTIVVLTNIGSPDSLKISDIRKYLRRFLGDGRVISIPYIPRKLLVNGIIAPFRAPKSAKLYRKLWTDKGSPLILINQELCRKLQQKLGDNYEVVSAMRYGNPQLESALHYALENQFSKIVIIPLFPQYASSTTGSIYEFCMNYFAAKKIHPDISFVSNFYHLPQFIAAFKAQIEKYNYKAYDHILFSYHGLPLKQVYESHQNKTCDSVGCKVEINNENKFCYQAACYATSRLLANELQLNKTDYTVCFQSRFAKKWLSPFADEEIVKRAKKGEKKLLVVSPAFVADCLETIVEIGDEYNELFTENCGEKLQLVESLNTSNDWIDCLYDMVIQA